MQVAIGSDHAGFYMKKILIAHLSGMGIKAEDCGTYDDSSCHYPEYASKVTSLITSGKADLGILVCGTGLGMSMAANKVKGIRAALVSDSYSAKLSRSHNNANVLCLGERVIGTGVACLLAEVFLTTPFEGGRHQTRLDMLSELEG